MNNKKVKPRGTRYTVETATRRSKNRKLTWFNVLRCENWFALWQKLIAESLPNGVLEERDGYLWCRIEDSSHWLHLGHGPVPRTTRQVFCTM